MSRHSLTPNRAIEATRESAARFRARVIADVSARPDHQIAPVSCILSTNRSAESRTVMSDLDVAKEEIAYLKIWLGILVVTDISTFGWLISNVAEAITLLLWAAVI